MRKLMAMLAMVSLAVTVSTSSWAVVGLQDVKFDGSMEVNGVSANNERDLGGVKGTATGTNDHRGVTDTRVRVGMTATVTENVTSRLEVVRNPGSADRQALYGGTNKPSSGNDELTNFVFHNAYVDIKDIMGADARLGRQYAGNAGDLVWRIGPKSDDNLNVNSIDGLYLRNGEGKPSGTIWDKLQLELFTGKFRENAANPSQTDADHATGDVNLNNFQATLRDVLPGGKIWIALLLGNSDNANNTVSDNDHLKIYRLGVNGNVMENMFTYNAEYLQNGGQLNRPHVGAVSDLKYKGNAFDLGAGFNSKETPAGEFGVNLAYVSFSGDDKSDNDDKSFHDFSILGADTSDRYFGEIFGKSNAMAGTTVGSVPLGNGAAGINGGTEAPGLQVFNIGAKYKPKFSPKCNVKLDYYTFSLAKGSFNNVDTGKKLGSEFDLVFGHQHTDNVLFELGAASFKPDEALDFSLTGSKNGTEDQNVTKFFARANIKWGGEEK